jgi:hypothetical protein
MVTATSHSRQEPPSSKTLLLESSILTLTSIPNFSLPTQPFSITTTKMDCRSPTIAADSRSPTLKAGDAALLNLAPKPPGHLFRIVKTLSPGVYLCLPRALPPPFEPTTDIDPDLHDKLVDVRSAFATVPNARLHQQLPLLSYARLSDVLYEAMQHNGTSFLLNRHLKMAMQLVVVKMSAETEKLRGEVDIVESLHRGVEEASLFIGSYVLQSQHTISPATSFAVLRPVYGPTLQQYEEHSTGGGIPGWLVGHIAIGLMDAVQYVHDCGVPHGSISASNTMINLYPTDMHHRYRGYPDIQLIDFAGATRSWHDEVEKIDVQALLEVIEELISKYSDVAPFLGLVTYAGVQEGEDPLISLLRQVRSMLASTYDGPFEMDDLRKQLAPRLEQMRHDGPETLPRDLMKLLHSDLVTGPELERAVQGPLVIRFQAKKEEMRKIVEDVLVEMGGAGFAGMKTHGIMVVRFTRRKKLLLVAIGEASLEQEDVEMGGVPITGAEMTDLARRVGAGPVVPFQSLFRGD